MLADIVGPDQTARMRKLIWPPLVAYARRHVYAGCGLVFYPFQSVADKGDVDTVVVTMKFPGGTIGILEFCRYSCYGYDIRLEVSLVRNTVEHQLLEPLRNHGNLVYTWVVRDT